ncbi:hypothetical protein [Mechercharimyces sp. CAU 1602]|uniref:hypothetical protein n=1 Tax=Mechercharimyces sp. CAU 1602 TaxID=2973933 RepID=UPI002163E3F0|nr:hypothetical protein [Mechercharimyces sp. CAU 1602]MCS1350295.1 hypothetical protein [Mechercharimyces sp. CAU 1602]
MIPNSGKDKIEQALNEAYDEVTHEIKKLLEISQEGNRFYLFDLTKDGEHYGVQVYPMVSIDGMEYISISFGVSPFTYIPETEWCNDDNIDSYSDYTLDRLFDWIVDCIESVCGKEFLIPCYISYYDIDRLIDMHTREWILLEDNGGFFYNE